jgi:heptosyltransferase-1
VPDREPLDAVAGLIAGAAFVVGVDTGLLHLAAAFGVPLAAIFQASEPGLTGPMGSGPIQVLGAKGAAPSVGEVAEAVGRLSEPR